MSYRTWHEYGYGVVRSEISIASIDRVFNLAEKAPEFNKRFLAWVNGCIGDKSAVTIEDIDDFEGGTCIYGIFAILHDVIQEVEHIDFCTCEDYDGEQYLIYTPTYPWYLPKGEVNITEETIENLLSKYIGIISDDKLKIAYQECENGG